MDKSDVIDVLMVERDPMDTVLIRQILGERNAEFKIRYLKDGLEALEYLDAESDTPETKKPDLIIISADLPNLDGYQLLQIIEIKKNLKDMPLLIVEKHASPDHKVKYQLLCNPMLRSARYGTRLSPFITVVEQYFQRKV